jgi:hypothetical protein
MRPSYHHLGDLVDFDQDVIEAYEDRRLADEAPPSPDLDDPQAWYE